MSSKKSKMSKSEKESDAEVTKTVSNHALSGSSIKGLGKIFKTLKQVQPGESLINHILDETFSRVQIFVQSEKGPLFKKIDF